MTLNPQSVELDAAILAIATRLYGVSPRVEKCQSERNYCAVLSFDGGVADRVIKIANHCGWAIEIERQLYPRMRLAGLPVPEVEFSHEDLSDSHLQFIVMPRFSELTLVDLCVGDREAAMRAVRESGQFIGSLDRRFAVQFTELIQVGDMSACLANQRAVDEELDLSRVMREDPDLSERIEQTFSTMIRPSTKQLTHGQPHTRNILADVRGEICAIDFGESIGFSSPLRDFYTLLISHDGWGRGIGDPSQREAILEGYGGVDDESLRELHYWEFRFWVQALLDYLKFAEDPSKDAKFVRYQLQGITKQVRLVAEGGGLIHRL